MSEKGQPLPKFGEWDVNNPASAEGFTVIFNKARCEKKTGAQSQSQSQSQSQHVPAKPQTKKWFCCILNPPTQP